MKRPPSQKMQESLVASFNEICKPEGAVKYRRDDGTVFETVTTSEAYMLEGHTAVVHVEGELGCVSLYRVDVVPSNKTDPKTPQQWQCAVDAAQGLLYLDSARKYGLVTGGPANINIERCEEILRRGAEMGIWPAPDAPERLARELTG